MLHIDIITLFPDMFAALHQGLLGQALAAGKLTVDLWNPRDYSHDQSRRVDDAPYGGGPGMVMAMQPLVSTLEAIQGARQDTALNVIEMAANGLPFTQPLAQQLSQTGHFVLVCGRYEGIDQRFSQHYTTGAVSLGPFVALGGEMPAMLIIDVVARLLPGVIANQQSLTEDSFFQGDDHIDWPHYTRPQVFQGYEVPEVLLSGDHRKIDQWRQQSAVRKGLDPRDLRVK